MNRILLLTGLLFLMNSCDLTNTTSTTEQEPSLSDASTSNEMKYDSLLAQRLGADAYGMRKYVMAFLKKGPNRPTDPEKAAALQKKHLENIDRLAEEGKLSLAGPFLDDGDLRGIYIFNVETIAEAEALTNSDPAIQSGSLVMELHPWYGSAALMDVNNIHNKITK